MLPLYLKCLFESEQLRSNLGKNIEIDMMMCFKMAAIKQLFIERFHEILKNITPMAILIYTLKIS